MPATTTPRVGINFSQVNYWDVEFKTADVFKRSTAPFSRKADGSEGPPLKLDSSGQVLALEPNCHADYLVIVDNTFRYPSGTYTLLYDGKGTLAPWGGSATVRTQAPGRQEWAVDATRGPLHLRLFVTDPSDPVRNIRIMMPGLASATPDRPWTPDFLDRWSGLACYRFMDLTATNGSPLVEWDQRPKPSDATWGIRGVPYEPLIDLANAQQADAWFNVPLRASNDYVSQFGTLLRDRLDPARKVYVEYSNECWNGEFPHLAYCLERGQALALASKDKPYVAAARFYAKRSLEIFAILRPLLGDRLIRVVGAQAVNPFNGETILAFPGMAGNVDRLAIGPYLGFNVSPISTPSSDTVATWTVDGVFDYLTSHVLPASEAAIRSYKALADRYGIPLVAYEGGQSLRGVGKAQDNDRLTRLFIACNAHWRMGTLYRAYLASWARLGGDLFNAYSSVAPWSKFGCFGALPHASQRGSSKYDAIMEFAYNCGQPV